MPIVYEPPQPFSPAISQGYGAAEQGIQDLPLIQHAQDQRATDRRMQFQAQVQNNALAAQAGQQNADRAAAEAARGAAVREGAYQFDESRRPSARDFFQADLGFQQTQQRFALHAAMQKEELSTAETMRLQRLQQAKGTIQQQVDEGQLTPEEGNALMTQAQTGINPLQQRQAAAKVKLEESQNQLEMDKHARMMIQDNEAKKFYAKTFAERVAVWNDPETGKPIHFYEAKPGQWEPVKNPEVAAEKSAKEAANLDAIRLKDYSTQVQRIEKANEAWAERRDKKDEAMALKNGRAPEPMTPEQIHQNFLDDLKKAGLEPTWEAQRAKMMGQDAAAKQPVTVTGSGQIPTQAGPPAAPAAGSLAAVAKPFKVNDQDTQTLPYQRQFAQEIGVAQTAVRRNDQIGREQKDRVLGALSDIQKMVEELGRPPMPNEPQYVRYMNLRAVADQVVAGSLKPRPVPPTPYQSPPPDPNDPGRLFRPAPLSSFRPPARRS